MGKLLAQISLGFLILEFKNPSEDQRFFGRWWVGDLSHPWGTLCLKNIRSWIAPLIQWQTQSLLTPSAPRIHLRLNLWECLPIKCPLLWLMMEHLLLNENLPGWKRNLNKCPDKNSERWTQIALHTNPGSIISKLWECDQITKLCWASVSLFRMNKFMQAYLIRWRGWNESNA